MIRKKSALEASGITDTSGSGMPIHVSTSARKYFRDNVSIGGESFDKTRNSELNKIIANSFSKSSIIKRIKTKSKNDPSKTIWGEIRKAPDIGAYYLSFYGEDSYIVKVINIITSFKQGPQKRLESTYVDTGYTSYGKPVRTTVTARKGMMKAYPYKYIDQYTMLGQASPEQVSAFIGELYMKNADKVKTYFRSHKDQSLVEVRGAGLSNIHFLSVIKDSTVDIISIQDTWLSKKVERGSRKMTPNVLRETFKGERVK
jgi:hypothetical protein